MQAWTAETAVVVDRLTGWPGGPRRWFLDHGAGSAELDALVARLRTDRR